jgi:hypothetical protein
MDAEYESTESDDGGGQRADGYRNPPDDGLPEVEDGRGEGDRQDDRRTIGGMPGGGRRIALRHEVKGGRWPSAPDDNLEDQYGDAGARNATNGAMAIPMGTLRHHSTTPASPARRARIVRPGHHPRATSIPSTSIHETGPAS